jgi:two-component system, NarL family, response regulator LiaR
MNENDIIRVMIVDDHNMVRDGLKVFMSVYSDLEMVAEADSGEEALRLCDRMRPDVILMDLKLKKMDGIAATRAIRERHPDIQIIALTSFADKDKVKAVMDAGAIGYLLKDIEADDLARAIRSAHLGKMTLSSEATDALVQSVTDPYPPGHDLTKREMDVLGLLVEGLSNDQIAEQLTISSSTVNFHVGNILAKLGVSNRTEAARLATQQNIIS